MSLALSTLIYEWRRYMAAVVALAFSGLLVLAQVGMFVGIGQAFTATISRSAANLMILPPKAEDLFGGSSLPRRVLPQIYMHPEVVDAKDMDGDNTMWQNEVKPGTGLKRKREFVHTQVVDPAPGSVTWPRDFTEEMRQGLSVPYVVAVDQSSLARLGVKRGDKATLNGRTVKVDVVLTGYPNVLQPTIILSRQTAKLIGLSRDGPRIGPILVRVKDPARADIVAAQLNSVSGGLYRAWTREELARANNKDLLQNQIVGLMLGFSLILGLLIGVSITWQTLRGAIFANIKEFASLRALGVSMGSLRLIVMELSLWVGVAGLAAAAALTALLGVVAGGFGMPLSFPMWALTSTGVMLLAIAVGSGALSLSVLRKSQPADLLR